MSSHPHISLTAVFGPIFICAKFCKDWANFVACEKMCNFFQKIQYGGNWRQWVLWTRLDASNPMAHHFWKSNKWLKTYMRKHDQLMALQSILPSTSTKCPVSPPATLSQSIMDPPPCLTVGTVFFSTKASPFTQKMPFLVTKKSHFGFISPKHIVPKGLRLLCVFLCILQMLHFVLRS